MTEGNAVSGDRPTEQPSATATATILDADIDLSLPTVALADLHAGPTFSDWLVIGNPHDVAVTARLTWVKPASARSTRRRTPARLAEARRA